VAPHKTQNLRRNGQIPHEKTDHNVAKKVSDVLTPDLDESTREKLHTEDIDTTWFGVVREEHEFPLFRDYGRYASLIAQIKDLRIDLIDSLSATSDQNETLFPSLVSFVGQTGAGKSTLIKLLIDLKSEPHERFPTPVVGAPGRDLSTSEDVHLYLDPDSSMSAASQAPLLFADCEGLEGGERDPIGAKLKKKLERASGAGHRRHQLRHTSERELTWADSDQKRSRDFAVAHLYPRLLYTFSDVIVFVLKNPR
jgi:energy-coupling factor transporter ATP-binding protein EcfA2